MVKWGMDNTGKHNSTFKKIYVLQYPRMQGEDLQQEVGDESGMYIGPMLIPLSRG